METRCRIPIWRTFGRIQWHVIPEPRITLQGAASWWIHCYDSRATCHITGCSHLMKSMSRSCHLAVCKNCIRHIENRFSPYFNFFFFLMQFDERPFSYRLRYTCYKCIHLYWITMQDNQLILCIANPNTRTLWDSKCQVNQRTWTHQRLIIQQVNSLSDDTTCVLKTRIMRLECGEQIVDTCSHFEADRDCVYAQFIKLLSHYW